MTLGGHKFPLRTDPCLNRSRALASGGPWSVGHGIIERYPAVVSPRPDVDPGDFPADGPFKKHVTQVPAIRSGRAAFPDAGPAEQAEAHDQAAACRSGEPWI